MGNLGLQKSGQYFWKDSVPSEVVLYLGDQTTNVQPAISVSSNNVLLVTPIEYNLSFSKSQEEKRRRQLLENQRRKFSDRTKAGNKKKMDAYIDKYLAQNSTQSSSTKAGSREKMENFLAK